MSKDKLDKLDKLHDDAFSGLGSNPQVRRPPEKDCPAGKLWTKLFNMSGIQIR